MKLSDIKAAIQAKANASNIVSPAPAQVASPAQTVTPVAPAAPVIAKNDKKSPKQKETTSTPPAQPSPQPPVASQPQQPVISPAQTSNAPVQQPTPAAPTKAKTSKAKTAASNTLDLDEIVYKILKPKVDYDRINSRNPRNSDKFILLKGGAEHLAQILNYRTTCEITKNIEQFNADDFNKSFVMYEARVTVYDKDGKSIAIGVGSCNSAESRFYKQAMADRINVCLKIAKKRAFVDAILTASGTSRFFVQDLDDLVINAQENEPVQ